MKIKKEKSFLSIQHKLLLNLLFQSKNIIGDFSKETKAEIKPFIHGQRFKRYIIDIYSVSMYIKRSLKLIKNYLQKNKKVLIIANSEEIKFLMNMHFFKKNENIFVLKKEWVHGYLTNPQLRKQFNFSLKDIELLFLIKSSTNDFFLEKEFSSLKIPIISFLTTSQKKKSTIYPIISNTDNVISIYILLSIFRKVFIK